jgi:lysophospholipase L1-like esterase
MRFVLLTVLLVIPVALEAAGSRWDDSMCEFQTEDSLQQPPYDALLFTGSSTIRLWKNLSNEFRGFPLLNRGFGGSRFSDLIHHYRDVIQPYDCKAIIIYSGDNDLASLMTPNEVLRDAQRLLQLIRKDFPAVPVIFIAIKPSIARWHLREEIRETNRGLNKLARTASNVHVLDIYPKLLTGRGKPHLGLLEEDGLHLNEKGYTIVAMELRKLLHQLKLISHAARSPEQKNLLNRRSIEAK